MGRSLLHHKVKIYGNDFVVMTTHLESTKEYTTERKSQLDICFRVMLKHTNQSIIFAGDLNLREAELKAVGGLPNTVVDAWEASGGGYDTKFTWDMKLNDNLKFGFKPRARFDRMFYKSASERPMECTEFKLVGKKRIEACGRFPSDHFGMLATFTMS